MGTNNFTANNTPGQGTGKIGFCVTLASASSQSLSVADNSSFNALTNAFTVAFWINPSYVGNARSVVTKDDFSTQREFLFDVNSSQMHLYICTNGTTGFLTATASNYGNLSVGAWVFVVGTWDSSSGTATININNGTANSVTGAPVMVQRTSPFTLGQGNKWDGSVDELGVWNRVLTSGEQATLYNSAAGKTCCPF